MVGCAKNTIVGVVIGGGARSDRPTAGLLLGVSWNREACGVSGTAGALLCLAPGVPSPLLLGAP